MDQKIAFDLGIGISAGSANLASYAAGQKGRNYIFYTEYGFRKQYASLNNLIRKQSYIDMDYVYGTLSNHDGENPLNYPAIRDNPMDFLVVATDAVTGQTRYFGKLVEKVAQMSIADMEPGSPYEIVYGNDPARLEELRQLMVQQLGYEPAAVYQIGAAVAANSGPRVVGVAFTRKKEG